MAARAENEQKPPAVQQRAGSKLSRSAIRDKTSNFSAESTGRPTSECGSSKRAVQFDLSSVGSSHLSEWEDVRSPSSLLEMKKAQPKRTAASSWEGGDRDAKGLDEMLADEMLDLEPGEDGFSECASATASHAVLVSAVSAAVAQPIARIIREAINERFAQLSSDLIRAVCETEARVAGARFNEPSPHVAAQPAPEVGAASAAPWPEARAPPRGRAAPAGPPALVERDVKALQETLADRLLEEEGLVPKPCQARRGPGGSRGAADGRTLVRLASVLPVAAAEPVEPARAARSAAAQGLASGAPPTDRGGAELHGCGWQRPPGPSQPASSPPLSGAESGGSDGELPSCSAASGSSPAWGPREEVRSFSSTSLGSGSAPSIPGEMAPVVVPRPRREPPTAFAEHGSDEEDRTGAGLPPALQVISGLIPQDAVGSRKARVCCQGVAGLIAVAASTGTLVELAAARKGFWSVEASCGVPGQVCWRQRGLFCDVPIAAGSMAGFLLLRPWQQVGGLREALKLLHAYARHMEMIDLWQRLARRETWWALIVWLCAAVAAGVGMVRDAGGGMPGWPAVLSWGLSAVLSGVFVCLCLSQLYVCRALMTFVDHFCSRAVDSPAVHRAGHEWSVLQAVLNKGSGSIEHFFVVLQGMAAFAVPLLIADFALLGAGRDALPALIPTMVLTSSVLRTFFLAAAVTAKCSRVPALLNSLNFGPGTDQERHYIVKHTAVGAAGFYVLNVKITVTTALWFLYMWLVVAFAIGTRFLLE